VTSIAEIICIQRQIVHTTHSDKITQIRAVQSTDGYYVVMSLCKLPITLLSLCSTRNTAKSLWWSA